VALAGRSILPALKSPGRAYYSKAAFQNSRLRDAPATPAEMRASFHPAVPAASSPAREPVIVIMAGNRLSALQLGGRGAHCLLPVEPHTVAAFDLFTN